MTVSNILCTMYNSKTHVPWKYFTTQVLPAHSLIPRLIQNTVVITISMEVERPDQGSHISLPLTDNSAAYLIDTIKQPTSMRSSCIFLQYLPLERDYIREEYVTPPFSFAPSQYRYLEHAYIHTQYETFNLSHSFSASFLFLAYINPRRPIYLHVLLFPFRDTCIKCTLLPTQVMLFTTCQANKFIYLNIN